MEDTNNILNEVTSGEYKYGFVTDIDTDVIHRGLDEATVRLISAKKKEPDWLLEFRLKAFRHWQTLEMPTWAHLRIPPIDYQDIIYYAAPKKKEGPKSMDEIDPELMKTFDKLGIPLHERAQLSGMAVDAVMDSVSVKTTFKNTLAEKGIIFCSFSEAVQHHPDLVQQYLGSVVSYRQLFRGSEFGCFFGWFVCLYSEGGTLPDGAEHLFSHQCAGDGAVRAHAHRGGRRCLRQLPGRLHGADARRESATRRHCRDHRQRTCRGEIFHRPELVSWR